MKVITFSGGVHPDSRKLTEKKPIIKTALPKQVVIPLSQHIGAPCSASVTAGQEVKKGQPIGQTSGFVSAPVHASISGKVVAIGPFPHPSGKDVTSVVIEGDGKDEWVSGLKEHEDYLNLDIELLKAIVKDAGIVGLGGATFPTHVKLSPPKEKKIDTVILNGAECEPYLTSDHRLMVEHPREIVEGLKIIMRMVGVDKGYIGIEQNKPDAIKALRDAASKDRNVEVVQLYVKYPQGAEKMLIKVITGREVPSGGLPMDVGAVVQNVGTAKAIFDAVRYGIPLIERVVTVTGSGIKEPNNFLVRIGTSFQQLIDESGGFKGGIGKIIAGGPMMGLAQGTTDVPVIKGTSGILVLAKDEVKEAETYRPCCRCGRCIDVCPVGLNPATIGILVERGRFQEAKDNDCFDCIECGSCSYICPAKRPLVQFIKLAKFELTRKS